MGVDHGRTGGTSPAQNLKRGDANANCLLQILSYRYKNERSVAFKIRQNPFSAGVLTPDPLVGWRRRHPSPYPTPLGTDPPLALAMHPPQKSSQIYANAFNTLALTYKLSRTLSVLFCCDVRVNSYFTPLWTMVAQCPHKL